MITAVNMGNYQKADSQICSGLGNKMFIIASTIGIALKNGLEFGFNWENQEYFVNPLPELHPAGYKRLNVPWGYHDIVCQDNSLLVGYMQSEKYFAHCANVVRHYFQMKPICEKLYNKVGLHFRAYSVEGVSNVHPEPSREYYLKALEHFPGLTPVVFTDNIERAKEAIGIDCEYICNSPIEDFYQLKNCDGVIMSNSSFSWWAGWLNGKAVAPSQWFGGRKANLDTNDLYCKGWTVI